MDLRRVNLFFAFALWSASAYGVFYVAYFYSFKNPGDIPFIGNMLNQQNILDKATPLAIMPIPIAPPQLCAI